MLTKQRMQEVILEHVRAEDAIDPNRVLATYSRESPVFEDVAAGVHCVGGAEIIAEYRNVWDAFPNLSRTITRWTIGEDSAVIEAKISGSHQGPFRGLPATGNDIELQGIVHFRFDAEGRIKQETVYYDSLSLLRQLGIVSTG